VNMAGNQDSDIMSLIEQLERLAEGLERAVIDDRRDMWNILVPQFLLKKAQLKRIIPDMYLVKKISDNVLAYRRTQ
jgi:hypothetical protein